MAPHSACFGVIVLSCLDGGQAPSSSLCGLEQFSFTPGPQFPSLVEGNSFDKVALSPSFSQCLKILP